MSYNLKGVKLLAQHQEEKVTMKRQLILNVIT